MTSHGVYSKRPIKCYPPLRETLGFAVGIFSRNRTFRSLCMRSNVVESRPPENVEIRGSNRPYQTGYRIAERDPQRHRAQSSRHKSQENQFRLTPGEGWLAMLLLGIAVYSVVFSIIFANWVDFSYILLFSTAVGLLLGLCVAKIQRF